MTALTLAAAGAPSNAPVAFAVVAAAMFIGAFLTDRIVGDYYRAEVAERDRRLAAKDIELARLARALERATRARRTAEGVAR